MWVGLKRKEVNSRLYHSYGSIHNIFWFLAKKCEFQVNLNFIPISQFSFLRAGPRIHNYWETSFQNKKNLKPIDLFSVSYNFPGRDGIESANKGFFPRLAQGGRGFGKEIVPECKNLFIFLLTFQLPDQMELFPTIVYIILKIIIVYRILRILEGSKIRNN